MNPLNVLMVAAEYAPLAKVGGLGDVTAALADALVARGHRVKIVLPLYRDLDRDRLGLRPLRKLPPLAVRVGDRMHDIRFFVVGRGSGRLQVLCVECESLFGRPGIYTDAGGADFSDAVRRWALLSRAALLLPRALEWPVDIIHAHDAQAVPVLLNRRLWYAGRDFPGPAATVLTIHNLAHQEIHPVSAAEDLGLPSSQAVYPGLLEYHGQVNLLKAGILAADRVNTVSPGYARETVTDASLGCGLQSVLAGRGKAYEGILNGTDYRIWDPARDSSLPAAFSVNDLAGKETCRRELLKQFGLKPANGRDGRPERPVCGFVGRLVTQKGVDLLAPVLPRLAADGFTFVVQGTGESRLEATMTDLAGRYPRNIAFCDRYDEALAHRIYAGSDVFLMPSLFEPCGLSQMYALRYGTPPVVRATGGLVDTVTPWNDSAATGFVFSAPTSEGLLASLRQVEKVWRDPAAWRKLQMRGMKARFDWSTAAGHYEQLYQAALSRREESLP